MDTAPMLLAEDLFLLLAEDQSGKVAGAGSLRLLVGGALLAELALDGTAVVAPSTKRGVFSSLKVQAVSPGTGAGPSDPLLAQAWSIVTEKPRAATDLVQRLGKAAEKEIPARLVARGILNQTQERVLGLFPTDRWPANDVEHERQVRARLHGCLVDGLTPDPRSATLAGLLNAVDQLHRVLHTQLPKAELRRRAKSLAEGSWASEAVRDAVAAASAAIIATSTAVAASGAYGG